MHILLAAKGLSKALPPSKALTQLGLLTPTHAYNLNLIIAEFKYKRHPISWWRPFFFRGMTCQGNVTANELLTHCLVSSLLAPSPQ